MTDSIHLPQSPDEITSRWLTGALQTTKTIEKTTVQSFQMTPVGVEQGFTGSLFRLELNYTEQEDQAPDSLIAKFSPVDPEQRDLFRELNLCETRFYQTLEAGHNLPVADCYYADYDLDTGASILLMQDLTGMTTVDFVEGCSLQIAERTVQALARIHIHWWNSPEFEKMTWLYSMVDQPYKEWWTQYPEQIATLLPDLAIPESFFEAGQLFSSKMEAIVNRLEGTPRTLIHRDIHSDNILVGGQSSPVPLAIVDWQVAGSGSGISDVAYFLIGSVPVEIRRKAERDLVAMYHNMLIQAGIQDYSFEQCWSDYLFSTVAKVYITVAATVLLDNTSEHRRAWRRADLTRLIAFIEDHRINEIL